MNSKHADSIRYLTAMEIYNINAEITADETFIRDIHLLNSAALRPMLVLFGEAQYPTLIDKAAALLHSLAYHHLFADGNKRTAVQVVTTFLALNHHRLTWDYASQYPYVLEVAQGLRDVPTIAAWLAQFVEPIP